MVKLILAVFISLASCKENSPKTVENSNTVRNIAQEKITSDSIFILKNLGDKLENREASFYKRDFNDSTKLIIDTIIYSPNIDKIVVFVITKNKVVNNGFTSGEYFNYDAYCYLGKRDSENSSAFKLKWLQVFYPINFDNKVEVSAAIKSLYFTELSTIMTPENKSLYKYNVIDSHFWYGPIWEMVFN